jgi:DNA-binding Xre family transcriptional regulator
MTKLGEYLTKRSVNRSEVARKTGLSNPRLSELSTNPKSKLRADELYKIALAIGTSPGELLEYVCGHITLLKKV